MQVTEKIVTDDYFENKIERKLVLRPIDGEKAKSSTGLVDPRLFKGDNNLRAIRENDSTLWYFKYDVGGIPEQLKGHYTSFAKAKEAAAGYFKTRNVEITEVIQ